MGDVALVESALDHSASGAGLLHVSLRVLRLRRGGLGHQLGEDALGVGAWRCRVPLGLELRESRLGRLGVLVEDRDEALLVHDRHAGHLRGLGRVDPGEGRPVGGRTEDPGVEEPGQADVAGVLAGARHLVDGVETVGRAAHDRELVHGPLHRLLVHRPRDAWPFASAP